jgi:hypothetical protein
MRKLIFTTILLLISSTVFAQTYKIDWYVIGSGGGHAQSSSYQLDGTIGQPIVGIASSSSYTLEAGFWVGASQAGGCIYVIGDINGNHATNGIDVTYGVGYFKGGPPPPVSCPTCPESNPFYAAGDVNGNCVFNGIDITYFVAYLKGGAALRNCADCPPASSLNPPAPAVEPILTPIIITKPNTGSTE